MLKLIQNFFNIYIDNSGNLVCPKGHYTGTKSSFDLDSEIVPFNGISRDQSVSYADSGILDLSTLKIEYIKVSGGEMGGNARWVDGLGGATWADSNPLTGQNAIKAITGDGYSGCAIASEYGYDKNAVRGYRITANVPQDSLLQKFLYLVGNGVNLGTYVIGSNTNFINIDISYTLHYTDNTSDTFTQHDEHSWSSASYSHSGPYLYFRRESNFDKTIKSIEYVATSSGGLPILQKMCKSFVYLPAYYGDIYLCKNEENYGGSERTDYQIVQYDENQEYEDGEPGSDNYFLYKMTSSYLGKVAMPEGSFVFSSFTPYPTAQPDS